MGTGRCSCATTSRPTQLRVGQMIYGFCNGMFGRDDYHDKRVEAIGVDWVVCRHMQGVSFHYGDPDDLLEFIDIDDANIRD